MERGIGKEEAEIQNELNEFLAASDALLFLSTEQDEELMSVKWGSLLYTPQMLTNRRSPIPNQGRNIKYPKC